MSSSISATKRARRSPKRSGSNGRQIGLGPVSIACGHFALLAARQGDFCRAARLEGYAQRALRDVGVQRETTERSVNDALMPLLHDALSPEKLNALLADGAAFDQDAAVTEALAL